MGLSPGEVVVLCGGTGGAKLARGLAGALGPERLAAVVNTGDDIEIYGAYVSPDPDLVSFWLADLIDDRGWGLRGDTFAVMDALRDLGADVWFNLGDRDLAWCARRASLMEQGHSPTQALALLNDAIGVRSSVLPMSDDPVRTWAKTPSGGWRAFQQFMIQDRAEGPLEDLEFRGADAATPSPLVLDALAHAEAIVIGPSNPLASIAPILAVPGISEAITAAPAPVVAVSPIVAGEVLKGPTAAFMAYAGQPPNAAGVAAFYGDLLDGIVADEEVEGLPALHTDTRMDDAGARERVAVQTLEFAKGLRR
ncbi:MAG TPA: 2-phospho-L-lactate transferase [Solirubrobacteraceae bacterium]|nr:2-phospho-L-lactate transferase [Solirubrobacteraceae bacterium]